ncbi:MAG: hypothetical protein WCH97_00885 [Actinomycetes bacterium]
MQVKHLDPEHFYSELCSRVQTDKQIVGICVVQNPHFDDVTGLFATVIPFSGPVMRRAAKDKNMHMRAILALGAVMRARKEASRIELDVIPEPSPNGGEG